MAERDLAIFTICSNNYVPMARVLVESARLYHPSAKIYLCLADRLIDDAAFYPPDCTVVPASALPIPDFDSFAFRYDIMEFNTALKPFMFRQLLSRGHRSVLYFDPDIEIFRPLDSVMEALRGGASFVLTPHICKPSEGGAFPDDIGVMRAGVFNLGFLAVGAQPETDSVLRWWSRRLQFECINDQANGIFVDQKFMDLVQGFAAQAHVLRDPSMNVAYWNLSQRHLAKAGENWLVDDVPLGFFHYSGFNPRNMSRLSKYTEGFRQSHITLDLHALMLQYGQRLLANGHGSIPAGIYAYGKFRSGTAVTDLVRHTFRTHHRTWSGNPFETYEAYLNLPAAEHWTGPAGGCVSNLMGSLREKEPWIQANYIPSRPDSGRLYADWFIKHAEDLVGDPRLIEPVAERLGSRSRTSRVPPPRCCDDEPDIDVIGYLCLALGLGEAGRLVLRSLDGAGLHARGVEISLNSQSSRSDTSCLDLLATESRARIQIFGVNADQIGQVIDHLGGALRPDSYRIITPFWELSNLPEAWVEAFDRVDEVWAPSRFIQAMLTRKIDKPVIRMPLPLDFDAPAPMPRARFGLPDDRFLFFFAFDYFSFIERKNPHAVVDAFKLAFRGRDQATPVMLVLKTLNSEIVPDRARALRDRLQDDPDIILIERTLSRPETLQLIACCDAVISLHRSEGLGLLVAEAMVLGKPVISTDYSATTELVSPQTGYPVDFRLIEVAEGDYPFHDGQHWADPDIDHAAWQMRAVFKGGDAVACKVAAARTHIRTSYGRDGVADLQRKRLRLIGAVS